MTDGRVAGPYSLFWQNIYKKKKKRKKTRGSRDYMYKDFRNGKKEEKFASRAEVADAGHALSTVGRQA